MRIVQSCQFSSASLLVSAFIALALGGCALDDAKRADFLPLTDTGAGERPRTSLVELRRMQLVSTNLVSMLVQLPALAPASRTLQISTPGSVFGSSLIRALEDAGYGLQRVSADQGSHYVSYRHRVAQTESGEVTDYSVAIGPVRISREYVTASERIFPSSLMLIEGVDNAAALILDDEIFREQGGEDHAFISGIRDLDAERLAGPIREVAVREFDTLSPRNRRQPARVLAELRRQRIANAGELDRPALDRMARLRRTVLIFDDPRTLVMGPGNKQAIRLLVRAHQPGDVFVVTACTDADGQNDAAVDRGIRVENEFVGHGVDADAVYLGPCRRSSFRHATDDSPVPVEIVQYREREYK